MTTKSASPSTAPDRTLGMACGLAVGMGIAASTGDLLLGAALTLCFGAAFSHRGLPGRKKTAAGG
ncbi:hypothetical protein J0910_06430 [Nocardiopsis sp. CNT-189]|uniref:hypothetical protein n=1 Tax=Nocardiopsis oceanisediminis TaxID=2816862 RepID=UPI003B2EBE3A